MDPPPASATHAKRNYLETCKATLRPKKRCSKRVAPKYSRHASRQQGKPRKTYKKPANRLGGDSSSNVCDDEEVAEERSKHANPEGQKEAMPLEVPRIDIVQPSPTIGCKSPNLSLERSPSMPAVLPDKAPEYMLAFQSSKPTLTRPLTSPSTQAGETGSSASPGWGCNTAGTSGRIPLLPLPGTPAVELVGHNFTTQEQAAPLHTCGTDTTLSVPTTFNFQDTTASSRSASFPGRQQQDGKYTHAHATNAKRQASTSSRSKGSSSRSTSLSSSVSRLTNQVRVLRVTNPDPPSPTRSAAPSRTPSMTIAQKRFVTCPPAHLQVQRANEYKTTPNNAMSLGSPVSRNTGTPTSSSNSASTPSFRFSDGGRSPASVATPTSASSSLPTTPTKPPAASQRALDLDYDYKKVYATPDAAQLNTSALPVEPCIVAPPVTRSPATPTKKSSLTNSSRTKESRPSSKTGKRARRVRQRSRSVYSGDGDDSAGGLESCFESLGAPGECERAKVRRKKRAHDTESRVASPARSRGAEKSERLPEHPGVTPTVRVDASKETEQKEETKIVKTPKSPLILSKPQVGAALDLNSGVNMENLTTFWTPIGRVMVSPAPTVCVTGLEIPSTTTSALAPTTSAVTHAHVDESCKEARKKSAPKVDTSIEPVPSSPRAFLIPRSPRPPNTRRLAPNSDPLSRSELHPPQYEKDRNILLAPPSLSVQNASLHLSLPLPSPIRLDAFTSDLLARCGGVGWKPSFGQDDLDPPPRRRSVDEGIKQGAKDMNERMAELKKALPSPGDPFMSSPQETKPFDYKMGRGSEANNLHASIRPSLQHTHPATLRPSTSVSAHPYVPPPTSTPSYPLNTADTSYVDLSSSRNRNRGIPPPLPPRPAERRKRDALGALEGLREQLVANGALVSGDEIDFAPNTRFEKPEEEMLQRSSRHCEREHINRRPEEERAYHRHRQEVHREVDDERYRYHRRRHATDHRSHRHKTAVIVEKDDILIPISKKTYPDPELPMGCMEYERARSYQKAQGVEWEKDRMKLSIPQSGHSGDHLTPCSKLEERLERSLHEHHDKHEGVSSRRRRGIAGYYCEEKARSGFAALQRQADDYGYTRERGQERGRDRERRHRYHEEMHGYRCDGEGRQGAEQVQEGVGEEDEDEGGAIRLGEHKRGFDTSEIERWLQGLKNAASQVEGDSASYLVF